MFDPVNILFIIITILATFAIGYYAGIQMGHGRQIRQYIQDARDNKRLMGLHSLRKN